MRRLGMVSGNARSGVRPLQQRRVGTAQPQRRATHPYLVPPGVRRVGLPADRRTGDQRDPARSAADRAHRPLRCSDSGHRGRRLRSGTTRPTSGRCKRRAWKRSSDRRRSGRRMGRPPIAGGEARLVQARPPYSCTRSTPKLGRRDLRAAPRPYGRGARRPGVTRSEEAIASPRGSRHRHHESLP